MKNPVPDRKMRKDKKFQFKKQAKKKDRKKTILRRKIGKDCFSLCDIPDWAEEEGIFEERNRKLWLED